MVGSIILTPFTPFKLWMVDTLWSAVYNCTEKAMLLCSAGDFTHAWRMNVDEPLKAVPVE